jgi:hypothetical protein
MRWPFLPLLPDVRAFVFPAFAFPALTLSCLCCSEGRGKCVMPTFRCCGMLVVLWKKGESSGHIIGSRHYEAYSESLQ